MIRGDNKESRISPRATFALPDSASRAISRRSGRKIAAISEAGGFRCAANRPQQCPQLSLFAPLHPIAHVVFAVFAREGSVFSLLAGSGPEAALAQGIGTSGRAGLALFVQRYEKRRANWTDFEPVEVLGLLKGPR
jgi:hypothetical protein